MTSLFRDITNCSISILAHATISGRRLPNAYVKLTATNAYYTLVLRSELAKTTFGIRFKEIDNNRNIKTFNCLKSWRWLYHLLKQLLSNLDTDNTYSQNYLSGCSCCKCNSSSPFELNGIPHIWHAKLLLEDIYYFMAMM